MDLKTSPDESLPLLPRTAQGESQERWQLCGCKHLLDNNWPEIMICAMCAQIYTSNQPQDLLLGKTLLALCYSIYQEIECKQQACLP